VTFKDESAKLLNETFGTDAITGGLKVGVAKITVNTGSEPVARVGPHLIRMSGCL